MELYLDSADINEIREASKYGFLSGLTTTPTFMYREGITDIDDLIITLSKMVPILQVEALGDTAESILKEAKNKLKLGLDPAKTVFKIPVSMEGIRACHMLRKENLLVNIHLVYTVQQAYMAMLAGATYVCPLVGRLQDQGHDALALVDECVALTECYKFDSKVMFSSVRNIEHVRNALSLGVHTITAPWKIIKALTDNHFTTVGTEQFINHTRLTMTKVKDVIATINPLVSKKATLAESIIKMTAYGYGAIIIVDDDNAIVGVFTDGDLRRKLEQEGQDVLTQKMENFDYSTPISISPDALLQQAKELVEKTRVDNILVVENNKPIGLLDIQEINAETPNTSRVKGK